MVGGAWRGDAVHQPAVGMSADSQVCREAAGVLVNGCHSHRPLCVPRRRPISPNSIEETHVAP